MSEKITKALNHQFTKHRIIFWYDQDAAMEEIYSSYTVPDDGLKLEVDNNEFHIRYQLLKESPEKQALVYSRRNKPADEDNWLLDLNLANFIFASDEAAMVLQELELNERFLPFLRKYIDFFRNRKERLVPLKNVIRKETEDEESLKIAMMSVLCGSNKAEREDRRTFHIIVLMVLLDSLEKNGLWETIQKFDLEQDFWNLAENEFSYKGETTPDAFLNHILTTLFQYQLGLDRSSESPSLYAHFDSWRKHQDYAGRVQQLLDYKEKELNISKALEKVRDPLDLLNLDLYKVTDNRIFTVIYTSIMNGTMEVARALQIIEKRRETYWYKSGSFDRLENHYRLLYSYVLFKKKLSSFNPDFQSLEQGWKEYAENYYELDGEYRRILQYFHQLNAFSNLNPLLESLEREYAEVYLQKLADQWQKAMDKEPGMESLKSQRMTGFFNRYVKSYLLKNQPVFLIITDGFRFDMGCELAVQLEQRNRFTVEVSALQAPLPSYTQLGMAAHLPHDKLTMAADGDKILADGQRTDGLIHRMRVIQTWMDKNFPGKQVRGMNAKEFKDLSRSAQNDFIRSIDLVLLYSAGADAVGDNSKTEENLPVAAAEEIRKLQEYCSHIGGNLSRTHILVTGDHGFLFRHDGVPDTERSRIQADENEAKRDARFIIAPEPVPHTSSDILEQEQLEWDGPFKAQFARGVNRFRRQGGGTRYVHGGRMPQEICVPLLTIKRTRIDDVSQVDVAVLDRKTRITTGQVPVTFLQESPVEVKRPARELEVYFESEDGRIISSRKKMIFDSNDPIDQNRSRLETFNFTKEADQYNGKTIYLKLYDILSGDTHALYREYSYSFQKKLQLEVDF